MAGHDVTAGPDPPPQGLRQRVLGLFASLVAGPFSPVILGLWLLLVVFAQQSGGGGGGGGVSIGSLVPADTPAIAAEQRSFREFGIPTLSRTVVVQHDPDGLSRRVQSSAVTRAVRVVQGDLRAEFPGLRAALPLVNEQSVLPVAKQDETTIVTYLFFTPETGWTDQRNVARRYLAALPGDHPSGVGVTGLIPARITQDDLILGRLRLIEVVTVAAIALIVGIAFRSLVAPLVTVAAGLVSYATALQAVSWAATRLGFPAPPELRPLMVVLLLGIVTDYAVFLLSGVRHHLGLGLGRRDAARAAVRDYVPVIVTAGLMVAGGAAVLLVASVRIYRAFGPGLAFTVLLGLLVAITLVPALLALLGRVAYWPSAPTRVDAHADVRLLPTARTSRSRALLARLVSRRSTAAVITVVTLALLALASLPLRHASVGFDVIGGLPPTATPRVAAEAAWQGFAAGILSPTEVVVRAPGITERRRALARLERLIAGAPGVSGVLGPRERPVGVDRARSALRVDAALVLAPDGDAARYIVVFDADPAGSAGIARYDALKARMPGFLRASGLGGASVSYAGDTAIARQTIVRTLSDLVRIGLAVVLVDLLLLMVFLRSLVAPLYLIASSVLALTASAGITVVIFQRLFGVPDLTYYVPFAAAVLLVSLGSDYNIFLVGRIWNEARHRPLREAVERGVPRATRAISIAAVALTVSFSLLALVEVTAFQQLAVLLAVGVLVDAFFVRALLVPSLITLFGHSSVWPRKAFGEARTTPLGPSGTPAVGSVTDQ